MKMYTINVPFDLSSVSLLQAIFPSLLITIIVIFYTISTFLLYFPTMIHKRKLTKGIKERNNISCIGHRGSVGDGWPENTLAAYKDSCLISGSDCIELDVWLTKDGVVVIHHDEILSTSSTNIIHSTKITDINYKDLPSITHSATYHKVLTSKNTKLSSSFTTSSSSTTTTDIQSHDYTNIPTLKQVFESIPNHVFIIVEFKQNSYELIEKVHKLIMECKRQEHTIWFSLSETVNKKLRLHDPTLHTMTSIMGMLKILASYYLCILPFMDVPEAIYGIPFMEITYKDIREEASFKALPDAIISILAYIFQGKPPSVLLASTLHTHLRRRGIHIFVLGVNTIEDVQNAVKIGATAVLTDKPSWLVPYVREHNIQFIKVKS